MKGAGPSGSLGVPDPEQRYRRGVPREDPLREDFSETPSIKVMPATLYLTSANVQNTLLGNKTFLVEFLFNFSLVFLFNFFFSFEFLFLIFLLNFF